MNHEQPATSHVDAESCPWLPFTPDGDAVVLEMPKATGAVPMDIAGFAG
jgi:hypothetical protein